MGLIVKKRIFVFLWLCCILGSWSIIPYTSYLTESPYQGSLLRMFFLITAQSCVFYGIILWLSRLLLAKTDLKPFSVRNFKKDVLLVGVLSGVFVGLILYVLSKTIFVHSILEGSHPPYWAGALASLYGGINEEVLLRLFFLTLIYFLFSKIFKSSGNRLVLLWSSTVFASLLFGLGHLPAAFKIAHVLSGFEVFRILFLNGIAGVVFGLLYWSKGFWTAVLAHFVADLVIHVLLL